LINDILIFDPEFVGNIWQFSHQTDMGHYTWCGSCQQGIRLSWYLFQTISWKLAVPLLTAASGLTELSGATKQAFGFISQGPRSILFHIWWSQF